MVDEETGDHQKKWSHFVEINKYFRAPLNACRSEPCLRDAKIRKSALVLHQTNLSLSWQLACNPADSSHLNDDCAQLPQSKQYRHDPKDSKNLKTKDKRRPKLRTDCKAKKAKPKVPVDLPKIMLVDAAKKTTKQKNNQVEKFKRRDQVKSPNKEVRRDQEERSRREVSAQSKQESTMGTSLKKSQAEPKKKYGVPLCQRPTLLLGPRYHADLQKYYQQQYYNQFMQQQQQQQMMQQMMYYHPEQMGLNPQSPRYAVPIESMYNNVKKGNRYCGNFYYR
ncbi:uncharacterized protein LOC133845071 [Drosophila sulfurigaster albostrigata]|uniref:uncharacterized protein LOC133845071 n=1 Tax=Drosophila sulfurigaster albostrigata TaxID=89887 RepID=UPI002D21C7DB|nr:uncharacterized protein LOC133845071 [Drosophila sulfurigaster albostrigata]